MADIAFKREEVEGLVHKFFVAADSMIIPDLMAYYANKATAQFGNTLGIENSAQIETLFTNFFTLIESMSHDIQNITIDTEKSTAHASSKVSYVVKGDAEKIPLTIPAMTVFKLEPLEGEKDFKIVDFSVYFDPSPLMDKVKAIATEPVQEKKI